VRLSPDARTYAHHAAMAIAHRPDPNISEDDLAAAFAAGSLHEKRKAKQLVRMAENGAQLKVPAIP
jgi:predicted oxidoreductase